MSNELSYAMAVALTSGGGKIMQNIYLRIGSIFLVGLLMALFSLLAQPVLAHGDDRMLRQANLAIGEYQLTIWTAPARLRAGEIHVETLVLDRTGQPVDRAVVWVMLTPLDHAGPTLRAPALAVVGAGQGMGEAPFMAPEPGRYRIEAAIFDETGAVGQTALEVEVIRIPRVVQWGIYLLLGASVLTGVWILKSGISLWLGRPRLVGQGFRISG